MLGSKTITSVTVFVATLGGVLWSGALSIEHLGNLGATSVFAIACGATVVGTLIFRYWRLHERSRTYFRVARQAGLQETPLARIGPLALLVGDQGSHIRDLPSAWLHALWVVAICLVGFTAVDGRTLQHLSTVPKSAEILASQYCPQESDQREDHASAKQGCELIRRAFELGFADDLGPCADDSDKELKAQACTLRQHDEPMAHYAWRLIANAFAKLQTNVNGSTLAKTAKTFAGRVQNLGTLYNGQRFALGTRPRASHHLFTNLPSPYGALESTLGSTLTRLQCLDRYHMLPHRPPSPANPELRSSVETDHLVGQLLFDTRYEAAVASCREFTVHWDSPADACELLAADPEGFLRQRGAWSEVREVLDRYETNLAQTRFVAEESGEAQKVAEADRLRWILPSRFVSFRCYFEEPRIDVWKSTFAVTIDGHALEANELRVNEPDDSATFVERYALLGPLLATGFHYDAIASTAAFQGTYTAGDSPRRFQRGGHGYLTKLDYFVDIDILLGHGWWVPSRDDLMEVYPYHVHTQNFIDMFRRQYRVEHSRL